MSGASHRRLECPVPRARGSGSLLILPNPPSIPSVAPADGIVLNTQLAEATATEHVKSAGGDLARGVLALNRVQNLKPVAAAAQGDSAHASCVANAVMAYRPETKQAYDSLIVAKSNVSPSTYVETPTTETAAGVCLDAAIHGPSFDERHQGNKSLEDMEDNQVVATRPSALQTQGERTASSRSRVVLPCPQDEHHAGGTPTAIPKETAGRCKQSNAVPGLGGAFADWQASAAACGSLAAAMNVSGPMAPASMQGVGAPRLLPIVQSCHAVADAGAPPDNCAVHPEQDGSDNLQAQCSSSGAWSYEDEEESQEPFERFGSQAESWMQSTSEPWSEYGGLDAARSPLVSADGTPQGDSDIESDGSNNDKDAEIPHGENVSPAPAVRKGLSTDPLNKSSEQQQTARMQELGGRRVRALLLHSAASMPVLQDEGAEAIEERLGGVTSLSAGSLSRDKDANALLDQADMLARIDQIDQEIERIQQKDPDCVPVDEKGRPFPYILPPSFPGTYPTASFVGTAEQKHAQGLAPLRRRKLLVKYNGIANSGVKKAFLEAGFRRTKGAGWNVLWGAVLRKDSYAHLTKFQRVNHFPGTWELGRKDLLYKNLARMRRLKGPSFDVIPRFFSLPREWNEFQQDIERHPGRLYIRKPVASSRGRGVHMVTNPAAIPKDCKECIVQRYIQKPLLINSYKFDLRVYVAVTCLQPLRVYIYENGLVRFATTVYSKSKASLKNRGIHLTNFSINKKAEGFVKSDADGCGSKWSLQALWKHLEQNGMPQACSSIWAQVHSIVARTMIAVEAKMNLLVNAHVPHRNICFEVYGFDILLDANLKAWLIEVNTCPSLACSCTVDRQVKFPMLSDLLHMLGIVPYSKAALEAEETESRRARLTGLGGAQRERPVKRDKNSVDSMCFSNIADADLPDIVRESESEWSRQQGWQVCLPCLEKPQRYSHLYEQTRWDDMVLWKYLEQREQRKAAASATAAAAAATGQTPGPPRCSRPQHLQTSIPQASKINPDIAAMGAVWERAESSLAGSTCSGAKASAPSCHRSRSRCRAKSKAR